MIKILVLSGNSFRNFVHVSIKTVLLNTWHLHTNVMYILFENPTHKIINKRIILQTLPDWKPFSVIFHYQTSDVIW